MKLSIIIVNFNSTDLLRNCLESLTDVSIDGGCEIIVYDNGDADPKFGALKNDFPSVKFIIEKRNISYAAANNSGEKHASGENLLFLNPDTIVGKNALKNMITFLESKEECAIVGPRLVNADGIVELSYAYDSNILSELYMRSVKKMPTPIKYRLYNMNKIKKVDVVVGAALLIRKDVFEQVGGFDEIFPLYLEESDLCKRVRMLGWKIYYYPKAEITHCIGGAGGIKKKKNVDRSLTSSETKYRFGQLRYYRKHNSKLQNILLRLYLRMKYGSEIEL